MTAGSLRVHWCRKVSVVGLLLFLTGTDAVIANPGDLDPGFGVGGRTFIDFPDNCEAATSIAQARDGKLLIGRWVCHWPLADHFSVVRLNTDGTRDPTFGQDGRTFAPLSDSKARGITRAVRELANGKIAVAGEVTTDGGFAQGFGLARFAANGAVDRSFGVNGIVTGTIGGRVAAFEALVEQPDGRLAAAGYVMAANDTRDMLIARFNADGSPDATFGTNGVRQIDFFGASQDDSAWELLLQADGRLVAAGRAFDATGTRKLTVVRTLPDGSNDATFGNDGFVNVGVPGLSNANISLQRQDDGKLVISGQALDQATEQCSAAVARLNPDGSLDSTFNSNGISQFPIGGCTSAGTSSIAVDPDGAMIVANTSRPSALPSDVKLHRLTSSGQLDNTFGINGIAIVEMGSGSWSSHVDPEIGVSMVRQSDGRIALTASDQFDWEFGGGFFMVARLLGDGASAGAIGFTRDFLIVGEASGSASAVVRRTGGTAGTVSVDFATATLTAGETDFTATRGTLTWSHGDASDRTITVAIADDMLSEDSEWLELTLSSPIGDVLLAASHMTLAIQDDEPVRPPPAPPPPNPSTPSQPPVSAGGGGTVDRLLTVVLALLICAARSSARGRSS